MQFCLDRMMKGWASLRGLYRIDGWTLLGQGPLSSQGRKASGWLLIAPCLPNPFSLGDSDLGGTSESHCVCARRDLYVHRNTPAFTFRCTSITHFVIRYVCNGTKVKAVQRCCRQSLGKSRRAAFHNLPSLAPKTAPCTNLQSSALFNVPVAAQ